MALEMDRAKLIKFYQMQIKNNKHFLEKNAEKLDILEGNLLPKVQQVLKKTLSEHYYEQIQDRIIPINILPRIIGKMAKVYVNSPLRNSKDKLKADDDLIKKLAEDMELNMNMTMADEYANLFKGYALEPFLDDDKPCLRVLPYDRFFVIGRDPKNPLKMTDFVKCMGKVNTGTSEQELYYAYTKEQFIPFTDDGHEYSAAKDGNDGINPYGVIPMVYGNRSRQSIIPIEDTDIAQMTKMIPVLLSDLGGAIMFQCFTIIYGINVKAENLKMSPNAFWNLKSDAKSDDKPSLGTIKPEVDSDKALSFIKQTLAFWLETKGVRIGAMNSMDAANAPSGIAKIIDEMDVYNILKLSIVFFRKEEKAFWDLMKVMHNHWYKTVTNYPREYGLFSEKFSANIEFDEPRPELSRSQQVTDIKAELDARIKDRGTAIKELNPDLSQPELEDRYERVGLDKDGKETEAPEPELDEEGNPIKPLVPSALPGDVVRPKEVVEEKEKKAPGKKFQIKKKA